MRVLNCEWASQVGSDVLRTPLAPALPRPDRAQGAFPTNFSHQRPRLQRNEFYIKRPETRRDYPKTIDKGSETGEPQHFNSSQASSLCSNLPSTRRQSGAV